MKWKNATCKPTNAQLYQKNSKLNKDSDQVTCIIVVGLVVFGYLLEIENKPLKVYVRAQRTEKKKTYQLYSGTHKEVHIILQFFQGVTQIEVFKYGLNSVLNMSIYDICHISYMEKIRHRKKKKRTHVDGEREGQVCRIQVRVGLHLPVNPCCLDRFIFSALKQSVH